MLTAIVPLKRLSTRCPGKNYREFAGRPLCQWMVRTLQDVPRIDRVVVSIDSDVLANVLAGEIGPKVVVHRREPCERGIDEVTAEIAAAFPSDHYLQAFATAPLMKSETISRAIDEYHRSGCDSLMPVVSLQRYAWWQGRPLNYSPREATPRTQDMEPIYVETTSFYLFCASVLPRRVGANPLLFPVDSIEGWDIDTEDEFRLGEMLAKRIR